MIEIKTRLHGGINKSDGGGEVRVHYSWATGPRNLMTAMKTLGRHKRSMILAYGNEGHASSWIVVDGITMQDEDFMDYQYNTDPTNFDDCGATLYLSQTEWCRRYIESVRNKNSATQAARALGSMTSPAKQASSRANGKRGGRPRITKYFSVGVGSSTDMERHPAPDFTCGHKHKSIEAAEECQRKLMAINPQTRQCSAKWYNSYIVGSSSTANSGWRGINDEKLYTD